jgi:ABC-type branched-subunit amino acid transport system ATPase component/fucose permease
VTWLRATTRAVRHPVRGLQEMVGDGPLYPLLILFALNAVDELDRTAFGILLPEIREAFDLDLRGVLALVAVVGFVALGLQVPIAHLADRSNRVRLALAGAVAWALFSFGTGLAATVWMLAVFRAGSGIGKAVVDPTHNSLIADYYEPAVRARVFSFHRAANAVGAFVGPIVAGLLAFATSWRVPFLVFAFPTLVVVVLGLRMRDPVRGAHERRAMGASAETVATEEEPPSFAESWRTCWKIESLRRIWFALPFLAASLIGFVTLAALLYDEVYGLDERARGFVAAATEPVQVVGLVIGARIGTRLIARDPGLVLRFLAHVAFVTSVLAALFALSPNLVVAVAANMAISAALAVLGPGILAALSLAIPPRSRAIGFSIASLWVMPGLLLLPLIGAIGDSWGLRQGMLVLVPVFLVGGLVISTAGSLVRGDIEQVWRTAAARSEALHERRQGRSKLLLVRGLNVSYGNVQVLFGVDFEVDEGEIVALLGTNGAGKSTLLRAISGVTEADRGAVVFDGRETTFAPPHEIAARGIVQMPGGAGVFPSLTVAENLEVAGWLDRHERSARAARAARVYELFPALAERRHEPAANLSGGQQQMLALGMALLSRPRLLMIDELSLGLAPLVVEQLLAVVREINQQGTTIILVEQSVNLALSVAETAYFMEKGEIRFHGPTAELLARPDVLRSVFLEGATAAMAAPAAAAATGSPAIEVPERPRGNGASGDEAVEAPPGSPAVPGAVLETVQLSRRFGGISALAGVSLHLAPGEILGIIGPNGAGKTTLLDVVTGLTPADGGRVLLGGHDVTALGPAARARRGLGRSYQDARLFPSLTVAETLAVALERSVVVRSPIAAALHLPNAFDSEERVAARVDELLDMFGIGAFRNKFVRELSTGSRRVVDLACVVAHGPSVVLLDEPSSGIAQRETEALLPLLWRIRDVLGASLVVIEHDVPLVRAAADRLLAMDQGEVIAQGAPDAVLHDPGVVESYLGTDDTVIARSRAGTRGETP